MAEEKFRTMDELIKEMNEQLKEEAHAAYKQTFEVLWRTANEKAALDEQVKSLHENGNKLLEEKRELRRMVKRLNDAFVSSEPDKARVRQEARELLEKTA